MKAKPEAPGPANCHSLQRLTSCNLLPLRCPSYAIPFHPNSVHGFTVMGFPCRGNGHCLGASAVQKNCIGWTEKEIPPCGSCIAGSNSRLCCRLARLKESRMGICKKTNIVAKTSMAHLQCCDLSTLVSRLSKLWTSAQPLLLHMSITTSCSRNLRENVY